MEIDSSGEAMARRGRTRAVATLLPGLTGPALRRHGPAYAAVISGWRRIIGAELADLCRPEKLSRPRGEQGGGVLHVRASGPAATDLQHMAPVILARINAHLGYRAVDRLRITQGAVTSGGGAAAHNRPPTAVRGAEPELPQITDADLRAVLRRLGCWAGSQSAAAGKSRS